MLQSIQFLNEGLDDKMKKNFKDIELKKLDSFRDKLEENALKFIQNILQSFKVDSSVVLHTLKLFTVLNFKAKQTQNADIVFSILDSLESILEIHKDKPELIQLANKALSCLQVISIAKE